MKEKIKEHKAELIAGGCLAVLSTAIVLLMRGEYKRGFQHGCNCTYFRVIKEFPDTNFGEFWNKYHQ